ncbi:16S rRNA (cytidine(1402)-2'-O)-methyltransferase [Azotosporobacter soli]|uniref:16S rRNA (cytidine(1402)-2'-O)-methyltransferase n=1 Tax=Azotosporobacter soli TaxID=3055040 RepID=UPI0031FE6227
MAGTLYLCATPIGNLEDMTYRAVRVLSEVSLIAAEDTRHSRKLLTHFDIHTPLISYHEHNKAEQGPRLLERLAAGEDIALVSDAGMPGISDPGADLAAEAIEQGIVVTALPGANAALTALVCSGLDTTSFLFVGFLPKTTKKRREQLEELTAIPQTLLFYESPHRLRQTLREMIAAFGAERKAAAGRELTKKFEEFIRGSLGEVAEHFTRCEPRGEFVLVLAGAPEAALKEAVSYGTPAQEVAKLVALGVDSKQALKDVALKLGLSKRDVYQAVLAEK